LGEYPVLAIFINFRFLRFLAIHECFIQNPFTLNKKSTFKHITREKVKVQQSRYRPGVAAFIPRKYIWCSVLLEAELTPGP